MLSILIVIKWLVITLNLHTKLKTRQNCRAFTLAELMIVMVIIAVLVGISMPIFMGQLEKSKEATDVANMRAAKSLAVELFYAGVTDKASAQANGLQWWDDPATGNNTCGAYSSMAGKPCIIGQRCIRQEDRNGYFP